MPAHPDVHAGLRTGTSLGQRAPSPTMRLAALWESCAHRVVAAVGWHVPPSAHEPWVCLSNPACSRAWGAVLSRATRSRCRLGSRYLHEAGHRGWCGHRDSHDLHEVGPRRRNGPPRPHDMQVWGMEPAHSWPRWLISPAHPRQHAGLAAEICMPSHMEDAMSRLARSACSSAARYLHEVGQGEPPRPSQPS